MSEAMLPCYDCKHAEACAFCGDCETPVCVACGPLCSSCQERADTLAAGRVFEKLQRAADKAGIVALIAQLPAADVQGDLSGGIATALRMLLTPNKDDLSALEAAADKVLNKENNDV